jgi:hypothetical protein
VIEAEHVLDLRVSGGVGSAGGVHRFAPIEACGSLTALRGLRR